MQGVVGMLRNHTGSTKELAPVAVIALEYASVLVIIRFWNGGERVTARLALHMGITMAASCSIRLEIATPSLTFTTRLEFVAATGATMLLNIIPPTIMTSHFCDPPINVFGKHVKRIVLQRGT
jgi:hypothetical protein